MTNTGTDASGFAIEVQTANGENDVAYVAYVAPGQTSTWGNAVFHGTPQAPHVVRIFVWPTEPGFLLP